MPPFRGLWVLKVDTDSIQVLAGDEQVSESLKAKSVVFVYSLMVLYIILETGNGQSG